jgi:hypothetical protein
MHNFKIYLKSGFLAIVMFLSIRTYAQPHSKLRVLVLTDIEADPDDSQSLIRFLTYCNQWDVEGLVAVTSIHQKTRVAPETIHDILNAYKKVQPNLLKHEKGYPTYEYLSSKIKKGLPVYGMEGVGKGFDSEGSDWIIKVLEKPDPRPLWICDWGGANCLAQALWKIRQTKTAPQAQALVKKIRVYTISDQDDSGPWIRKTFPDLFFVCSPGYTYGQATWLGMSFGMPGSNKEVVSNEWLAKNIQQGHGPLGTAYPDVAYGMEGDSPSFLFLIANGLNDPEHPNYGGMNFTHPNCRMHLIRLRGPTGRLLSRKPARSGQTPKILFTLRQIKKAIKTYRQPSGAGGRNFRTILQHELPGPLKVTAPAITRPYLCWPTPTTSR